MAATAAEAPEKRAKDFLKESVCLFAWKFKTRCIASATTTTTISLYILGNSLQGKKSVGKSVVGKTYGEIGCIISTLAKQQEWKSAFYLISWKKFLLVIFLLLLLLTSNFIFLQPAYSCCLCKNCIFYCCAATTTLNSQFRLLVPFISEVELHKNGKELVCTVSTKYWNGIIAASAKKQKSKQPKGKIYSVARKE